MGLEQIINWFQDAINRSEIEKACAEAQTQCRQSGRNELYFDKLRKVEKLLSDLEKIPTPQIRDDTKRLRDIINLKVDDPRFICVVKDAIDSGFTVTFLHEVIGEKVDVELLDPDMKKKKLQDYLSAECPTCLEPFSKSDYLQKKTHRTFCHHLFHADCLKQWVDKQKSCPTCRHPVNLPLQQKVWQAYLISIDEAVKEHCKSLPEKPTETCEYDEIYAKKLHEEQLREEQERARQIQEDAEFALRLSRE